MCIDHILMIDVLWLIKLDIQYVYTHHTCNVFFEAGLPPDSCFNDCTGCQTHGASKLNHYNIHFVIMSKDVILMETLDSKRK